MNSRLLRRLFVAGLVIPLCLFLLAVPSQAQRFITDEMLLNAEKDPTNWLMYARDYRGTRYSPLDQINTSNVNKLVPKWIFQMGALDGQTTTPIVNDGIMYVTSAWSHIFALNAKNGRMIWKYDHPYPEEVGPKLCCDVVNRGVALYKEMVYFTTIDAHVVALNAKTGKVMWDSTIGDWSKAYTLTVAPLAVKGKIIVGLSGAEYPTRLYIQALDADTGDTVWRRYTIPAPGEPGNETWSGDSWQYGGGSAWVTGTYDPQLNLVYWGVGNPAPDWDGASREGDNLYTGSALALNPDTGEIAFHFQYTPHDVWDYDGNNENILIEVDGHKVWVHGDRNGHLYLIDRTNGKFIYAKAMSRVNWAKGFDENGRPIVNPDYAATRDKKVTHCPGANGGKAWNPMSYSDRTKLVYVPVREVCMDAKGEKYERIEGEPYWGLDLDVSQFRRGWGELKAFDPRDGSFVWGRFHPTPITSAILTTGGGLAFYGVPEGDLIAVDDTSGQELWRFQTGSGIVGHPTSFMVDNKQYIATPSGWGGWIGWATFGEGGSPQLASNTKGDDIVVFGLFEE